MKKIKSFLVLFTLFLFVATSVFSQEVGTKSNRDETVGVVLDGLKDKLIINGISVGYARVYGRKSLLIELLGKAWLSDAKLVRTNISCECALLGTVGQCTFDYLPKVQVKEIITVASEKIRIVVGDQDFMNVLGKASSNVASGDRKDESGGGAGGGNNGDSQVSNSSKKEPEDKRKEPVAASEISESDGCKPEGEICFNTKGEISFSLGCEGKFKFELSSSGKIKMGLSNKAGQSVSFPLTSSH